MDDSEVAVMYITANTIAYIIFILFILQLHTLKKPNHLALKKATLLKTLKPTRGIALRNLIIDAIMLRKEISYCVDIELLTLDCLPQVQGALVQRYNLCKVATELSLHDYDMLASHLSDLILLLDFHQLSHFLRGKDSKKS